MPAALAPTRDALLGVARTLPPAAQIISGICDLLQDVNTDLDQIAHHIRMDAALAGRVIRVSNSVVYGGRGSVSSVEEAVGRVGFSEVVRLVGTATVTNMVDRELQSYHVATDVLREGLLLHALASEALAEAAGADRHAAYVCGLLRGVGLMVLDRYARGKLTPELTFDPSAFTSYRDWETARFGVTATRVTTMALDDWRFPEEIVSALEAHIEPPTDSTEMHDRLANIVNLAGAIATDYGRALPGEVVHWTRTPEKLVAAGIDEDQFANAAAQAFSVFDQQRQALY